MSVIKCNVLIHKTLLCVHAMSSCYQVVSTGVEEVTEAAFNFYPNPARDLLIVELSEFGSDAQLMIFDLNGQIVSSHTSNGQLNIRMDVSSLASGMYILQVSSNDAQKNAQLIIQ